METQSSKGFLFENFRHVQQTVFSRLLELREACSTAHRLQHVASEDARRALIVIVHLDQKRLSPVARSIPKGVSFRVASLVEGAVDGATFLTAIREEASKNLLPLCFRNRGNHVVSRVRLRSCGDRHCCGKTRNVSQDVLGFQLVPLVLMQKSNF
jgi:hypothetical protein